MKNITQQKRITSSQAAFCAPEGNGHFRKFRSAGVFAALMLVLLLAGIRDACATDFSATISANQTFIKAQQGARQCGASTFGTFTSVSTQSYQYCYATQSFTANCTTMDITCTSTTASDPMLYVYTSFTPGSATSGFLIGDDDSNGGLKPKITCNNNIFVVGQTYTIVVTTYNRTTTSGTVYFSVNAGSSCGSPPPVKVLPTVTTSAASGIGSTSATLGGNCTNAGGGTVSAKGVAYGTTTNPTGGSSMGSGTGTFSGPVTGLSIGTLYYARAWATNEVGTAYGAQVSFTTVSSVAPSVTTTAASAINQTTATAGGTVTSNGGSSVTAEGIDYGTSSPPSTRLAASGTATPFSVNMLSLVKSTRYYVRAYATNSSGTGLGAETSFVTNHEVIYTSNGNGTISGSTTQNIANGGSGSAVTPVPASNYHFVNWSDGSTANPRTETNVTGSKTVAANFAINKLIFYTQPSNTLAGANIPFTIRVVDVYGNLMTNSDGNTITVAISTNPGGGTLAGTMTLTPSGGVASSSNIWINKTGVGYKLTATCTNSITSATSGAFNITPTALKNFTVEGITDPVLAGVSTSPVVKAWDTYDNLKTNYTGTVVFSSDDPYPAVLPANYAFTTGTGLDNGIHTYTNQLVLKTTVERTVTVNDGTPTGSQTAITVIPNILDHFHLVANGPVSANVVTAGLAFTATATAHDVYNNVKTDYIGAKSVNWTTTAGSSISGVARLLPANGNQTFVLGVATNIPGFTFYNSMDASPTLTITDANYSKTGTTTVTVNHTDLDNFKVVSGSLSGSTFTPGTSQMAGVAFSVQVTARDIYYNTAITYAGNVRFKSSDDTKVQFPGGLQSFAPYATYHGVKIYSPPMLTLPGGVQINTTGSYWLRCADAIFAFKSGEQQNIVVGPGPFDPATGLSTITIDSPNKIAGQWVIVTLTPKDQFGNKLRACQNIVVKRDGSTVDVEQLSYGTTAGSDGIYLFAVKVTSTTAPNLISATLDGTPFGQTYNITVTPAPPDMTTSTITPVPTTMTTNQNSVVTVQLKDAYGNVRTTNDGVVSLTTTLGGFNANNGLTTVAATYGAAGSGRYTATLYASYSAVNNGVGTATISGTIAYNEDKGPGDYPAVTTPKAYAAAIWPTGTGNFASHPTVAITEGLPNLATSTITSATSPVTAPVTMTTDGSAVVTVQLKDFLGNLITHSRGTVLLSSTLGALTAVNDHSNGTYTATLTGDTRGTRGTGTAVIGGTLDGSAFASGTPTTTSVIITEGMPAVSQIVITTDADAITADGQTTVRVQLKDQFGNLIVSDKGPITLSTTLGEILKGNGTHSASDVIADYDADGKYTATFRMYGIGVGVATITGKYNTVAISPSHAHVTVTNGVATQFAISIQPAKLAQAIAGIVFNAQPEIRIKDQYGNLVIGNTGNNYSISATRLTGTADLQGTTTVAAVAGVVTFTNLSYNVAELINIKFSSSNLGVSKDQTSDNIDVWHNVPSYMAITRNGGTGNLTAGVLQSIFVKVYDSYGNPAIRFTGAHSMTFSGAGNSPTPPYTPKVVNNVGAEIAFGGLTALNFALGSVLTDMILYLEQSTSICNTYVNASYTDTWSTTPISVNIASAGANCLPVNVVQAGPAYLAVTGSATQVAGTLNQITVRAYDAFNNPATGYTGAKTFKFSGPSVSNAPVHTPTVGGVNVGSDVTITFVNGVAANIPMYLFLVEATTVSATEQGTGGIATRTTPLDYRLAVNVTHAPESYYAVTGTSATQTAGTSQTITIKAYDAFNNQATSYAGDKSVTFTGANPSNAPVTTPKVTDKISAQVAFGTAATITFTGGSATGTMSLYLVEPAVIVATTGSITTRETSNDTRFHVLVNHAAPNYLAITRTETGYLTAGANQTITIKAYDTWNNLADGGNSATPYAGVKNLTFGGANPSPAYAPGVAVNPKVNTIAFGTATSVTFTAGVATATMNLYKVETAHVTTTDGGINADSHRLDITVIHAAPSYLAITRTASGDLTAGVDQPIVITAYDTYNNVADGVNGAAGYNGSKNLTFTGASASPVNTTSAATKPIVNSIDFGSTTALTFALGTVTSTMNLYNVELAHVTTTDDATIPLTSSLHKLDVNVIHATEWYFAVTGAAFQIAGNTNNITIKAYDHYNNVATRYTGDKILTFSGALPSPSPSLVAPTVQDKSNSPKAFGTATTITFVNGVTATRPMVLYRTGTVLIDVADGSITAIRHDEHRLSVGVTPALLKNFVVTGVGTVSGVHTWHYYGDKQSVTVEARDFYDNRKTNFYAGITFSVTDVNAAKPDDYTFTTSDLGIHTFVNQVQFSQISDPYSPGALGWWVTAVSLDEPWKYGYQQDIWVVKRPITLTGDDKTKNYYGDVYAGTLTWSLTSGSMPYATGSSSVFERITSVTLTSTGTPAAAVAGAHPIVPSNATGDHGFNPLYYDITYSTAGTLTVVKRPLVIAVTASQSKIYGASDPVFSYSLTSGTLVNGDVFSGNLARTSGENAGSYTINQGALTIVNGSTNVYANYDVTFTGGTFVINKKDIAINVNTLQHKTYGDSDPAFGYSSTPAVASLPFTASFTGALVRATGEVVGSTYAISKGSLELIDSNMPTGGSLAANYNLTFTGANFEIQRKAIAINVTASQSKVYGVVPDPTFAFTTTPDLASLPFPAKSWTGALVRLITSENVAADYAITQGSLELTDANGANSLAQNYTVTFNQANFAITKKDITITVNTGQHKVYSGSDPVFTYTSSVSPLPFSGAFIGSLDRTAGENVAATYAINSGNLQITDANSATSLTNNYNMTFVSNNFEITRKPITITVTAGQNKVYGNADPLPFTYSSSVVPLPFTGGFTGALTRVAGETFGTYAISRGSLQISDVNSTTSLDANYTLNFVGTTFEITKRPITITANTGQTKVYGHADPSSFTYAVGGDGLAPGDAFSGALDRTAGETVAAYPINIGSLTIMQGSTSKIANYTVTYETHDFTITKRPITVTANLSQTKVYGNSDPLPFTYTVSEEGLATGDAFSGVLGRDAGETVGTYPITKNTLTILHGVTNYEANYTFTYVSKGFTITNRPITITANTGQTKVYGHADPSAFTYAVSGSGLAPGDAFSGALDRISGETVAAYAINQGSLTIVEGSTNKIANYTVIYVTHDFTITQRPITITANTGQTKVYGHADLLPFTYTVTGEGLASWDAFSGSLIRVAGETVAAYAINQGTLTIVEGSTNKIANYAVTYVSNNFTITTRAITITANTLQTKVYGNSDPLPITYTVGGEGLATGDAFSGVLVRVTGETVGVYAINQGTLTIVEGLVSKIANYSVTYNANNFTITPKPIAGSFTVDATKVYDGNATANVLTRTIYGKVGSDDVYLSGGSASYDNKNVGTGKTVTQSGMLLAGTMAFNYTLTSVATTTADITPRTLILTNFAADNKTYDGTTSATGLGFTDNRVSGDNLAFIRVASFDNAVVGNFHVVNYTSIIISGGIDKDNYVLATTTGATAADIIIYARGLTITANSITKVIGLLITGAPGSTAFTSSGLQNGETIGTVTIAYGAGSQIADPLGLYAGSVTATAAIGGTFTTGNYAITYIAGDLTVIPGTTLTGNIKYYNTPNTVMNNAVVTLKQGGVAVKTATSDASGIYSILNVVPGDYQVVITSAKSTSGAINATDAAQANSWQNQQYPIGVYSSIEKVRFFSGDVTGDYYIHSNDAAQILSYFVQSWTTWAGKGPGGSTPRLDWTFWKKSTTTTVNPNDVGSLFNPSLTVAGVSQTQDFWALVTGDFNREFVPGSSKQAYDNVRLNYGQTVKADVNQVVDLQVNTVSAMATGAVSLILNYPSDKLEIVGVTMNGSASVPLKFNVIGNELRIGWNSEYPLSLNAGEKLLTVKVKVTGKLSSDETVRFTLAPSELNEIADDSYTGISGATLTMNVLGGSALGITPVASGQEISLTNYPNPFIGSTTLAYTLPVSGTVTLEIRNLLGSLLKTIVSKETQNAGDYQYTLDATTLETGVYTATLKLENEGQPLTRTIKIVRTR